MSRLFFNLQASCWLLMVDWDKHPRIAVASCVFGGCMLAAWFFEWRAGRMS